MISLWHSLRWMQQMSEALLLARQAKWDRLTSLKRAYQPQWRHRLYQFQHLPQEQFDTVIDVGAHQGDFLADVLAYYQPKTAIAIEPLPDAFTQLQLRFGSWPHVRLYNCALGAKPGESILYVNHHKQASSLLSIRTESELRFDQRDLSLTHEVTVPVRSLDEVVTAADIGSIDLLKLDVQGYEYEVFTGAESILPKVKNILLEVSFYSQYEGDVLFWEIHHYLQERGFVLYWLGDYQTNSAGTILQGDAVYRRTGGSVC